MFYFYFLEDMFLMLLPLPGSHLKLLSDTAWVRRDSSMCKTLVANARTQAANVPPPENILRKINCCFA